MNTIRRVFLTSFVVSTLALASSAQQQYRQGEYLVEPFGAEATALPAGSSDIDFAVLYEGLNQIKTKPVNDEFKTTEEFRRRLEIIWLC